MTTTTLLDFNADTTTRLLELMETQDISTRDRLKQSAEAAGTALEWAKPMAMGDGKRSRLYAGPAVMVMPGSVVIMLARRKQVLPIWLRSSTGKIGDAVEAAVGYVEAMMDVAVEPRLALRAINEVLQQHGHPPDKRGAELENEHNTRIAGMLFAALPAAGRAHLIKGLDMAIGDGICPSPRARRSAARAMTPATWRSNRRTRWRCSRVRPTACRGGDVRPRLRLPRLLQRDLDQSPDRLGARQQLALAGEPVINGSQLVGRQPDPDLRRALALAALVQRRAAASFSATSYCIFHEQLGPEYMSRSNTASGKQQQENL